MWTLTGFADEISHDVDEQIALLKTLGIRHIEFRSAWGTKVLDLTELAGYLGRTPAELRAAFDKAGLICPSAHIAPKGPGGFSGDLSKLADEMHVIGVKSVMMPIFCV